MKFTSKKTIKLSLTAKRMDYVKKKVLVGLAPEDTYLFFWLKKDNFDFSLSAKPYFWHSKNLLNLLCRSTTKIRVTNKTYRDEQL